MISKTDAQENTTTYAYDANGNRTRMDYSSGKVLETSYAPVNLPVATWAIRYISL